MPFLSPNQQCQSTEGISLPSDHSFNSTTSSYNDVYTCLIVVFQDNLCKQVPQYLHSGFYWTRMMETTAVIWHVKALVKLSPLSPPTNQHQLFTRRTPFVLPNQQCHSTEGKNYHTLPISSPQAHPGVFQSCLWPAKALGYLGKRSSQASRRPSDASTP